MKKKKYLNESLRSELSLRRKENIRKIESDLSALSDAELSAIVEANAPVSDKVTLAEFLARQKTAKKILKARQHRDNEKRRRERNAKLAQSFAAFEARLIQDLSKLSDDELKSLVAVKPVGLIDPELARFLLRQRAAKKVMSDRTTEVRRRQKPPASRKQSASRKQTAKGKQKLHWTMPSQEGDLDEVWNRPRWV